MLQAKEEVISDDDCAIETIIYDILENINQLELVLSYFKVLFNEILKKGRLTST